MTDQLRQAAQQALEALEHHSAIKHPQQIHYRDTAIAALKAALEQQAEPPPEWPLIKNILDEYGLDAIAFVAEWKAAQQQAEPVQEPYESPYNPNPVEYQYHYPDGSWSCSNGEVINGMHPDRARSLYALKDNT